MYNFPEYKEQDLQKIIRFMTEHPFVMLIGKDSNGRIVCTQIPVLVDERDGKIFITGHIARKTDHEKAFAKDPDVLMVFTSPNTYVSGSWYTGSPQVGSTWNYISVHARGRLNWMDEAGLRAFMKRFTLHFERGNTDSRTIYDNLPSEYIDRMIKGIVAFEMEVVELEDVHKLSQNRDEKSYRNIIDILEKQDDAGRFIAGKMKENAAKLFNPS